MAQSGSELHGPIHKKFYQLEYFDCHHYSQRSHHNVDEEYNKADPVGLNRDLLRSFFRELSFHHRREQGDTFSSPIDGLAIKRQHSRREEHLTDNQPHHSAFHEHLHRALHSFLEHLTFQTLTSRHRRFHDSPIRRCRSPLYRRR